MKAQAIYPGPTGTEISRHPGNEKSNPPKNKTTRCWQRVVLESWIRFSSYSGVLGRGRGFSSGTTILCDRGVLNGGSVFLPELDLAMGAELSQELQEETTWSPCFEKTGLQEVQEEPEEVELPPHPHPESMLLQPTTSNNGNAIADNKMFLE